MRKIYLFAILLLCISGKSALATIYYVTNNNPNGTGSLNGAIVSANSHPGKDSVYFNIPIGSVANRTITISSIFPLPSITDPIVIDGTTQVSGNSFGVSDAKIQIKAADYLASCLVISASDCEIYGLYIHHFVDGVIITGGNFKFGAVNFGNVVNDCTANCIKVSNVITGSFLSLFVGTDTSGLIGISPTANGISITSSKKITIGGKQTDVRNIISGNNNGIYLSDSKFIDIQGNYIGTDLNGAFAVPNTNGIVMTQGTNNCEIGGDSIKERNLISGNSAAGMDVEMYNVLVDGNYIGVDATGTLPLGNGTYGIYLRDLSHDNTIGAITEGSGNVIAYNGSEAIYFQNSGVKNIAIRGNRMYCNSQNTGNGGIVVNEGNQGILPPIIVIVTPTYVSGYVQPDAEVDIYSVSECITCEGGGYLGTVTADASGVFIATLPVTGKVTATANDAFNNTSEFAICQDSSSTSCLISSFSASSETTCSNVPISFTDLSIPAPGLTINSWSWDFGDETYSSEQDPTHVYDNPGSYNVQLVVGSSTGCTDTSVQTIIVTEGINTIINADTLGCLGSLLHFADASISTPGTFIVSWSWDLGDNTTSFFNEFDYAYDSAGIYTVVLSVINSDGCLGKDTVNVQVQEAPVAAFDVDLALCPLDTAYFVDLSTAAEGDSITNWHWNFGDGDTSILQNPTHLYQTAGVYTISLVVSNGIGCTDTTTTIVEVVGGAIAAFTYVTSGSTVFFTNTSDFPPDFDVKWKFGDGGTSNQISPTHTFPSSGGYLVCMIVIDNTCGLNDTTCENVFVIVGVDEPAGAEHILVYPNPATDQVTVEGLPASNNIETIRLLNTLGAEVRRWNDFPITGMPVQLQWPGIPEGLYFLEIRTGDFILSRKLIVQQP